MHGRVILQQIFCAAKRPAPSTEIRTGAAADPVAESF
jgi:hypothetical protein